MTAKYRLTVAAIVLRPINPVSSPYPPVLLQWSSKAAQKGEGNLATPQGGLESTDTDPITAVKRELTEEHGLPPRSLQVFPLAHPRFCSRETGKEYVWFLARCNSPVTLVPNPLEVAAADWYYCPQMLESGVRQMRGGKGYMFRTVFEIACRQHPEFFGEYVRHFSRQRKARRLALERHAHRTVHS